MPHVLSKHENSGQHDPETLSISEMALSIQQISVQISDVLNASGHGLVQDISS